MVLETNESTLRRATFADARRRWSSSCPPNQLEQLVESAVIGACTVEAVVQSNTDLNLVQASAEARNEQARNPESGRTLNEAIHIDETNRASAVPVVASSLQPTIMVRQPGELTTQAERSKNVVQLKYSRQDETRQSSLPVHSMTLASDRMERAKAAGACMRRYLELRDKVCSDDLKIRSMLRSIEFQRGKQRELAKQRAAVLDQNGSLDVNSKLTALEEIKEGELNCERVLSQLDRQLTSLTRSHKAEREELVKCHSEARETFRASCTAMRSRGDPLFPQKQLAPGQLSNRVLHNCLARELGLDRIGGRTCPRSMGVYRPSGRITEDRKALFMSRFSHAATINCDWSFPMYCLAFDRTGRYFMTGADDFQARIFCLGGEFRPRKPREPESYTRGAVLVCTLRGHVDVIIDMAVSPDNAFLATTSNDGDCRIWGLRDGSPVAILRGHTGGANAVRFCLILRLRCSLNPRILIQSHSLFKLGVMVGLDSIPFSNRGRKRNRENLGYSRGLSQTLRKGGRQTSRIQIGRCTTE